MLMLGCSQFCQNFLSSSELRCPSNWKNKQKSVFYCSWDWNIWTGRNTDTRNIFCIPDVLVISFPELNHQIKPITSNFQCFCACQVEITEQSTLRNAWWEQWMQTSPGQLILKRRDTDIWSNKTADLSTYVDVWNFLPVMLIEPVS